MLGEKITLADNNNDNNKQVNSYIKYTIFK